MTLHLPAYDKLSLLDVGAIHISQSCNRFDTVLHTILHNIIVHFSGRILAHVYFTLADDLWPPLSPTRRSGVSSRVVAGA